ncbi:hypothetical protein AWF39_27160 [Escherichia coli]|nr:hypothetical protein AWF39_27160 [Escherichia coli]
MSWDLLRKFVDGKVAAKVADVIAKLTATQAFAAFIFRDIGRRLVIFIRDSRTAITALITAIGPGTGVGQHDAPRKNRTIRFRRRGQYKRSTDRTQFAALLDAPAADHLLLRVGGTVVRRKVYARFLDAVNFVNGNSDADPEQEVISRWRIEQCSELSAVSASFVLSTPTETDGAVFPGRIMLANTCTWTYRGDECGYHGPAVADEYDQPTSDITKDKCSKCLSGCKFRNNVGNFGGFLSINKLSQ